MELKNRLLEVSFELAIETAQFNKILLRVTREYVLCKQLLKSSTSIGANIEEAFGAESSNDFIHKLSIAYKEARETDYWLRLLAELYPQFSTKLNSIASLNKQMLKMTYSSIKTLKSKQKA